MGCGVGLTWVNPFLFAICDYSFASDMMMSVTVNGIRFPIAETMALTDAMRGEPIKQKIMTTNLIELAKECPNVIISISAKDLVTANEMLVAECAREMEQTIADNKNVTYLTSDKVMKMLSITSSTLWRWKKTGYLVPIVVGGQQRYKSTDIQSILENK